MAGPNHASTITNNNASIRLRAARAAPAGLVKALPADANKRVRRAAERRLQEGPR